MSESPRRIVFLYAELAGYIRACMEALANRGVEVHVFHWPVNPEAPFSFDSSGQACRYYLSSEYGRDALIRLIKEINPHAIVCSGWIDKHYLAVCRSLKSHCRMVVALDNQLPKSARGKLALMRARIRYKQLFAQAWVPGSPQVAYARRMGFSDKDIHTGFYTIDVSRFNPFFGDNHTGAFPRRFVFVGRYVASKGVSMLWEAFRTAKVGEFTLTCSGTGTLWDARDQVPGLEHTGFVQPSEMDTFVRRGGVFVLPSIYEPWGVVLHEFAASGYPLISSEAVGAASSFLENNANGTLVKTGSLDDLREALESFANLSDEDLWRMARHSARLGQKMTQKSWIETALKLLE